MAVYAGNKLAYVPGFQALEFLSKNNNKQNRKTYQTHRNPTIYVVKLSPIVRCTYQSGLTD